MGEGAPRSCVAWNLVLPLLGGLLLGGESTVGVPYDLVLPLLGGLLLGGETTVGKRDLVKLPFLNRGGGLRGGIGIVIPEASRCP